MKIFYIIICLFFLISTAIAQEANVENLFTITVEEESSKTILYGKVTIHNRKGFDYATLSFEAILGVADKPTDEFNQSSIQVMKNQVFYMKVDSILMYKVEVVQEYRGDITLEFSRPILSGQQQGIAVDTSDQTELKNEGKISGTFSSIENGIYIGFSVSMLSWTSSFVEFSWSGGHSEYNLQDAVGGFGIDVGFRFSELISLQGDFILLLDAAPIKTLPLVEEGAYISISLLLHKPLGHFLPYIGGGVAMVDYPIIIKQGFAWEIQAGIQWFAISNVSLFLDMKYLKSEMNNAKPPALGAYAYGFGVQFGP